MQLSSQSNDFIHSIDLDALANLRSAKAPIFSLYLDLRPEKHSGDLLDRFNKLLQETERQKKLSQDPPEYQEQWIKETDRIRRFLEKERPFQGQGLAVLSSQAEGLWQVLLLPVSVVNRLVVKDQPYVRPLQNLNGEFKCTLTVLVDNEMAQFMKVYLGSAEELDRIEAVPVTGGDWENSGRLFARAVVERAETVWQEHNCGQLVIAGSEEMLRELHDELPESLREPLAGEVRLSHPVKPDAFITQVMEIEGEQERQLEAQRVKELLTRVENNEPAVLGLEKTLLVVRSGKVRLLVVEEDFHQAGGECPNCGFIAEAEEKQCLLCGMELRPEPDIIEVSINRVLDHGGEIEVLRSRQSRGALTEHGRIGALLYEPGTEPVVRDMSNQRRITKDGEIDRDVLHDEAMEESFPGSDPPSF